MVWLRNWTEYALCRANGGTHFTAPVPLHAQRTAHGTCAPASPAHATPCRPVRTSGSCRRAKIKGKRARRQAESGEMMSFCGVPRSSQMHSGSAVQGHSNHAPAMSKFATTIWMMWKLDGRVRTSSHLQCAHPAPRVQVRHQEHQPGPC